MRSFSEASTGTLLLGLTAILIGVASCGGAQSGVAPDMATSADMAISRPDLAAAGPLVGGKLDLVGFTSDDWIVYADVGRKGVWAVAATGGAPVAIDPGATEAIVSGKFAFAHAPTGTLTAWTAAMGPKKLADNVGTSFRAARPSLDGQHVAFMPGDFGEAKGLVVARSDGSARRVVLANSQISPILLAADGHFVFSRDEGAPPNAARILDAVVVASGAVIELNRDPSPGYALFEVDPTGKQVLFGDSGGLHLVPVAGGPARLLDAKGSWLSDLGGQTGGVPAFTPDGGEVLFVRLGQNGARDFVRAKVADRSMQTVLTAVAGWATPSPDYKTIAYGTRRDGTLSDDLYVVGALGGATPAKLEAAWTHYALGIHFTTDGRYVLMESRPGVPGTLAERAYPVAGGAPAVLSSKVVLTDLPLRGARVLLNVNPRMIGGVYVEDMVVVDADRPMDPPTVLVSAFHAAAGYGRILNPTRTRFAYANTEGLRVVEVP